MRSVRLSVCLSVCPTVSRITHERVDGCRPNMVGVGEGRGRVDPLQVVKIWC